MRLRTRKYLLLAFMVIVVGIYAQFAGGSSALTYYGGVATLLVLVGGIGLPWLEFAPDGAFRRQPRA